MRFITACLSGGILIAGGLSCAAPTEVPPLLPRSVVVHEAGTDAVRDAYAATIDALIPHMGHEQELQRQESQRAFETICLNAARPGAAAQRQALCRAIASRLGPDVPQPARVWMLRQLERIGRGEVVSTLAVLLNDPDARIRELARRCLQHIPHPAAGDVLRQTLARVRSPAWRVALINALAARRDTAALALIVPAVEDANPAVAAAAIAALGDIGGARALRALAAARAAGAAELRLAATYAYLRCADRLLADGAPGRAAAIYEELYAGAEPLLLRRAALTGLVRARGHAVLPMLLELICGPDAQMGLVAARLAEEIPGEATTRALADRLAAAPPAAQVLLLDTLAARGDTAGLPAATAALKSDDAQVRSAALKALGKLGTRSTALVLAERAAAAAGDERDAARASLDRLAGAGIDETIAAALDNAEPGIRVELLRALGARRYTAALPKVLKAAVSPDESVQVAAFHVLAELAGADKSPELIRLLTATRGEQAREAAEAAVVSTCLRSTDPGRRAAPVLAALNGTQGAARAALIRVLGRLGGDEALEAIRTARSAKDADVSDAAVRALASWQTPAVVPDLLEIAESTPVQAQRVLALRGCVRLLRQQSAASPAETLELLTRAMNAADRPEEKKLVLAGLADVPSLDALRAAEGYLGDAALRDEAASAMLAVAAAVSGSRRAEALAAVETVRAAGVSPAVRDQAAQTIEQIERFDCYSTAWSISGPYTEKDKNAEQLFNTPFAPELLGAAVEWRPLQPTSSRQPWRFNLAKALGGSNRCVYVKTMIWSEAEQPARLDIGSDDGVKAWLNGRIAHEANVYRGLTAGEDKVAVNLKPGWNELLLKITQGGGDWGFCAGVRSPDGTKLAGLKFKAEQGDL